jgi:hypothetical protein
MMRALGYEAKKAKAVLIPFPFERRDPCPTDVVSAERVLKSESIQYPAENGLANAKVIDAIYRSAWEQREIRL